MKITASQLDSVREYKFHEQTIQKETLEVSFSSPQPEATATLSTQAKAIQSTPITQPISELSDAFSPEDKLKILILKKTLLSAHRKRA
ncbi:hypothetical protein [Piscirickettsia litoralis]|uniref:Uncharacterized protein n=1 Tax=Piscirickettsia litoralis TaxID=1891921 RepID=A0ABX3A3C2_9GAMM|nr:hypothetical protein [Piscirickettsia litoralis]ODN43376.1 hypothetical protein BGC07_11130 [Piscirickettsia litoralis]